MYQIFLEKSYLKKQFIFMQNINNFISRGDENIPMIFPPTIKTLLTRKFLYLLILASESKQMNSSYFIKTQLIFRQKSLPIPKILLPLHRKTLLSLPNGILQGYCFLSPLLVRRKCSPQNYLYFSIIRKKHLQVAGCKLRCNNSIQTSKEG